MALLRIAVTVAMRLKFDFVQPTKFRQYIHLVMSMNNDLKNANNFMIFFYTIYSFCFGNKGHFCLEHHTTKQSTN